MACRVEMLFSRRIFIGEQSACSGGKQRSAHECTGPASAFDTCIDGTFADVLERLGLYWGWGKYEFRLSLFTELPPAIHLLVKCDGIFPTHAIEHFGQKRPGALIWIRALFDNGVPEAV